MSEHFLLFFYMMIWLTVDTVTPDNYHNGYEMIDMGALSALLYGVHLCYFSTLFVVLCTVKVFQDVKC